MKILVTCPPMLNMISFFEQEFQSKGFEVTVPEVIQTLTEGQLIDLLPSHDGWIIGDDPATSEVFRAGKSGNLKAAVKWGIGVDNVDFSICEELGIAITNTPNMFGAEVADLAMGYVTGLARELFLVDRGVRVGGWPKPAGISLAGKKVALIGFGDIGKQTAKRLDAAGMHIVVYDPNVSSKEVEPEFTKMEWPHEISEADFIVVTCALTQTTRHMIDAELLARVKPGVRIVNVSRGPIICQDALERALKDGMVHSAALDVYETEPLPQCSYLLEHPRCILGSHNASNTIDAVVRTSLVTIETLARFLNAR